MYQWKGNPSLVGMLLTERLRLTTLWSSVISGHFGRLYTSVRRWNIWTVVWENTNGVNFRAVWENTAHAQGMRCSTKGSHLIPRTSAVFSNTALKWTPFAYHKITSKGPVTLGYGLTGSHAKGAKASHQESFFVGIWSPGMRYNLKIYFAIKIYFIWPNLYHV